MEDDPKKKEKEDTTECDQSSTPPQSTVDWFCTVHQQRSGLSLHCFISLSLLFSYYCLNIFKKNVSKAFCLYTQFF